MTNIKSIAGRVQDILEPIAKEMVEKNMHILLNAKEQVRIYELSKR